MIVVAWVLWLVWLAVKFVIWILGALVFCAWWMQTMLLYLPVLPDQPRAVKFNDPGYRSPEELDLDYEDVYLHTRDGVKIHGWLMRQTEKLRRPGFFFEQSNATLMPQSDLLSSHCPTIVFFHGNAGNIGYRLPNMASLLRSCGCNVFIFDYRGYGNSDGTPSEKGLLLDGEAVVGHLRQRPDLDPKRIFLFGRSLGGAVAIGLAERLANLGSPVQGLLVENSFTDIADMGLAILRQQSKDLVTRPLTLRVSRFLLYFLVIDSWDSVTRIQNVDCPVLFLSGRKDELIPPQQMDTLYAQARASQRTACKNYPEGRVSIYEVPNGKHNNTFLRGGAAYYARVAHFLKVWS